MSRYAAVLFSVAAISLSACGGGSDGPTAPSGPQRTVLGTGTFAVGVVPSLSAFSAVRITTNVTGDLDVSVNWNSTANDIDIGLYRGECSFEQLSSEACTLLVEGTSLNRPERITRSGLSAGVYTLWIVNLGPGSESGSWEAGLTR